MAVETKKRKRRGERETRKRGEKSTNSRENGGHGTTGPTNSRPIEPPASIDNLASARPDPLLGRQGPEHGGEVPRDGEEGPRRRRQRRREPALGAGRRRRRALGRRAEPALLRRRRRGLLLRLRPRRRRRGPDRRQCRQDVARGGSHLAPDAMRWVRGRRGEEVKTKEEEPEAVARATAVINSWLAFWPCKL
jgi:hypothetical protein